MNNICELLDNAFAQNPDGTALFGLNQPLSYTELYQNSLQLSNYLANTKKGTTALMLPNLLAFPVGLFGAWYADKTITLINPLYTSDELLKQCLDGEVSVIIIAKIFYKTLDEIIDKTQISTIITVEIGDFQPKFKAYILNFMSHLKYKIKPIKRKYISLNEIVASQKPSRVAKKLKNKIALLQYTGGTSGSFKAAVLTHKNLLANIGQLEIWLDGNIGINDKILTALPLYHIFALTINCLLFVHIKGCSVLVLNPRQPSQLISALQKHQIEIITGVNTLFAALVKQKGFGRLNWSKFKVAIAGGMALDKSVSDKWQAVVKKPIVQGYGLTECSPVVSAESFDTAEFSGSVGQPLAKTQVRILDKSQAEIANGEVGEIAVKGAQVMQNYWQKQEQNQQIFTKDGYFLSGDMGYFDELGRIKIVDRAKDLIIISGFNVYPCEIEQVLNQHLKVLESACIGVDDEVSGQAVKAFVVKKAGADLSEKSLIEYCQKHLAHYKIPHTIEWIAELPKSNIGKILKRELV